MCLDQMSCHLHQRWIQSLNWTLCGLGRETSGGKEVGPWVVWTKRWFEWSGLQTLVWTVLWKEVFSFGCWGVEDEWFNLLEQLKDMKLLGFGWIMKSREITLTRKCILYNHCVSNIRSQWEKKEISPFWEKWRLAFNAWV